MINYTWKIDKLKVLTSFNSLQNVVYTIFWTYTGKDENDVYSTISGSTDVPQPDTQLFVPFESLTETTVITWLENTLGENSINQFKAAIEQKIDEIINPKTKFLLPPWTTTE